MDGSFEAGATGPVQILTVEVTGRCRCGQTLGSTSRPVAVSGVPRTVASYFEHRSFCSVLCLRAYLLELFERLDLSASPETIGDLHELYSMLQAQFALAELASTPRALPNGTR